MSFPVKGFFNLIATVNLTLSLAAKMFCAEGNSIGIQLSNNLDVVKNYFKFCVDGKDVDRVAEFFAEDVVVHRPDCIAPIVGMGPFKKALKLNVTDRYESIHTTFQKEVVAGDVVVVALKHQAKGSNTWHGFDVAGKDLAWTALTYFRFNTEGKIVEEIVERNELFMAKQLGIIEYA
ncbi:ester cyclase [Pseudomonas sp. TH39(2020)]|uniref:ester cyclase n=1 Tax=Pseudomonas sp. TH39(2020) TaxID=2796349 RepID=UPI001914CCD4|nr:ester cyclase [Pseudomonas sp. TH39(2020)]MBK5395938.1 ester cyclase [Pseudomonas sp. TH39(2020)]